MNVESKVERFTKAIISNKIKTLFVALIFILLATSGLRFLETPSGYRSFVENDQPNYQDILNIEEKYGNIDVLTFVIKPNEGDIFQKDALEVINQLTELSWKSPYSSRVSSLTNYQYTTVEGDDININDFINDIDSLNDNDLQDLKKLALQEKNIVNFILSKSAKVSFVNITLDVPSDVTWACLIRGKEQPRADGDR